MGTVFNPSGVPEEGAKVRVFDSLAKVTLDETVSDAAGQYTLTAPAGSYKLQSIKSGFRNANVNITLSEGEILSQDLQLRSR